MHLLTPDYDIYRKWLIESLASYPDRELASNVDLVVDAFDVVEKKEYPSEDKLKHGAEGGYDVVMMTGSSELRRVSCPIRC